MDKETHKGFVAAYLKLSPKELDKRIEQVFEILKECTLCPRNCKVDRTKGETGFCRTGIKPIVSSWNPHFGEERPLVGYHGSGTIFFTHCNLGCLYCQNYSISHLGDGQEISYEHLTDIMLSLQKSYGCHNINFVTPTHQVYQILMALKMGIKRGLNLPLVYNCGGYESLETLRLLDGIIDIYMPDIKYSDNEIAKKYSKAENYPEIVKTAIKEMHRQVGDLIVDESGIALRGLIVRHLVLPNNLAGTEEIVRFLAEEISPNTYTNIMAQYHPCFRAFEFPSLNRRITAGEYSDAIKMAKEAGLRRLD